jgi:hypothetical protein
MWSWLIIVGVAVLVWRATQPRSDLVIRMRRGQPSFRGKLAAGRRAEIERYLTEQFADVGRLRIDVHYPRGSRRLRVRVRGSVSPGERQQVRNFLTAVL